MNGMERVIPQPPTGLVAWLSGIVLAAVAWVITYAHLTEFADAVLAGIGMSRDNHLGEALHFFFYDTPKVLLLLTGIVFLMGIIQTFFSPERTRALLSGKRLAAGNAMAATLGIVTPFCSCSAVPLFIGFLSAGVPLGVTFSFLISAPMVNEVALALLFGLFGWKVAALYLGLGLLVAIVAGFVIGELKMERHLEDWVRAIHAGETQATNGTTCNGWNASRRARNMSARSSARSGLMCWWVSHWAPAYTAMCRKIFWSPSWAMTHPGGPCRQQCCWVCPCTPTRRASFLSSRR